MIWLIASLGAVSVVLAWLLHNWLRQRLGDIYEEFRPELEWGLTLTLSLIILHLWSWTPMGPRIDVSSFLGPISTLFMLSIMAVGWRNIRKP